MPTTIQIHPSTLHLLKKAKEEHRASSYDETIRKVLSDTTPVEEMAGFLKKFIPGSSRKELLAGLRDKHERF
ncbi:hypothetical protein HYV84_03950 [Candidatus Woesearchaeota archaeon]|nr:hypothetical protein [Candidatus Woesearchaeota archaeon]